MSALFCRWKTRIINDGLVPGETTRRSRRGATSFGRAQTLLRLEPLEDRTVPSILVTTTADSGAGSLRAAIMTANGTSGTSTIDFDIGPGTQTIAVLSPLPTITSAVIIDATPPASFSNQAIVLEGASAGSGADGLDVAGGSSTIDGDYRLAIDGFSESGIVLEGTGGDLVQGSFIGTNSQSASSLGDGFGITINGSANTIGGTGAYNLISGNTSQGIVITGAGATGNVVEFNDIGTDANGGAPLPNGADGILIEAGASGNSIAGGTNLVSANGGDGIHITGSGTDDNVVTGNVIGTDSAGKTALGNSSAGVAIDSGASGNTIGATSGASINLISGNLGDGVLIGLSSADSVTTGNVVDDNAIGTDVSGKLALANGGDGVLIQGGASNNTVGGTVGAINLISANMDWGVVINGGNVTGTGDQVDGNAIGTAASGTMALGNTMGGVEIVNGAANDTIGGTTSGGAINLIAGNGGMAQVLLDGSDGISIGRNAIGTDVTGEAGFGTGGDGIRVQDGAGAEILGGFNLISGNNGNGITITGSSSASIGSCVIGTDVKGETALPNANGVVVETNGKANIGFSGTNNLISGNLGDGVLLNSGASGVVSNVSFSAIGVDATGTKALPNNVGIEIDGSTDSVVNNLISGNLNDGILIEAGSLDQLADNVIGADVTGTKDIANGGAGIELNNSGQCSIGGNIIAFNFNSGVLVGSGSSGVGIQGNSIFGNGGLPISLAPGANNSVMPPVLTSVIVSASGTTITGTLTGMPNTAYVIEFYVSPSPGQGQTPEFSATTTTDLTGQVTFSATTPTMFPTGEFVTGIATDPSNNTSEFSAGIAS